MQPGTLFSSSRLLMLGVLALLASAPALTPAAGKAVRVGVIFYYWPPSEAPDSPTGRAFVQGLREKGWVEGRDMQILWRSPEGRWGRIPAVVDELVKMPVDVLVVSGNDFAHHSIKIAPAIPVVMASSDYPVENGLAASYARPGGNVTGLTNWAGRSLNAKRLALLKEAVPGLKRVAILISSNAVKKFKPLPETQAALDQAGISVFPVGADQLAELDAAFADARRLGANGMFVTDYPFAFLTRNQARISELAVKHRLPVIHSASTAADAGALLTYGPDITENFRRAGHMVDRILRGAKPAEIPIEDPARLDLIVNLKAARAIGLTIPPSVLTQASRIIE